MNGNGRDNIVIGFMVIFTYFLIYMPFRFFADSSVYGRVATNQLYGGSHREWILRRNYCNIDQRFWSNNYRDFWCCICSKPCAS